MNVLYTCDNNYVWLMGISMISLFENNKTTNTIDVYLLGENISEENKILLNQIAEKYNRKCIVIDMPEIKIPKVLISTRWPKSAFTRLYSADLLPKDVDKIIYLDCDTLVLNSLDDIEKIEIDNYAVCGKKDCIGTLYRKNIGLKKDSKYINAGVLLLNLKKLRTMDISKMIDAFLSKYMKCIHYADQDVLNGIFENDIGILPAEYNVMTLEYMYSYEEIKKIRHFVNYYEKAEIENAVNNPKIIHFTTNMTNIRPWYINSNHPKVESFLKYKELSPWKDKCLLENNKKTGVKNKFFNILHLFPRWLEINTLGLIHSRIYPYYIILKSKIMKRGN